MSYTEGFKRMPRTVDAIVAVNVLHILLYCITRPCMSCCTAHRIMGSCCLLFVIQCEIVSRDLHHSAFHCVSLRCIMSLCIRVHLVIKHVSIYHSVYNWFDVFRCHNMVLVIS